MTAERFYKEKRTLQVLQSNYNDLLRWVLWSLVVILVIIVVFGLCGSVWAEGAQTVRLYIVSTFCLGLLTTLLWKGLGAVHESSAEVLSHWKREEKLSLHIHKFLWSTRPVRLEIGSYFYADRSMILTLLNIIMTNPFNVLLTT